MSSIADISQVKALLHKWVISQISTEQGAWLNKTLQQFSEQKADRLLFMAFSSIPRYTSKADLQLSNSDLKAADTARSGWDPAQWSLDQAGRALLLLSLPAEDGHSFHATLEKLFNAADVSELIALYQSLPLLPHSELFIARAAEGLRTSIDAVFNAVALRNPFPGDYFEQPSWNQMILKAVFVGSPLHLIQQLDQRANAELARMLSDYAHERWAAKREVTPELWRLIGPFLNDQLIADVQQALETTNKPQQLAAALACVKSSMPAAKAALELYPDVHNEIESLNWDQFSQLYLAA
ncbi:MAG: EboA family metabolite traffic protein [Cyanobacteria bacterium P01_C01_bin.118]